MLVHYSTMGLYKLVQQIIPQILIIHIYLCTWTPPPPHTHTLAIPSFWFTHALWMCACTVKAKNVPAFNMHVCCLICQEALKGIHTQSVRPKFNNNKQQLTPTQLINRHCCTKDLPDATTMQLLPQISAASQNCSFKWQTSLFCMKYLHIIL